MGRKPELDAEQREPAAARPRVERVSEARVPPARPSRPTHPRQAPDGGANTRNRRRRRRDRRAARPRAGSRRRRAPERHRRRSMGRARTDRPRSRALPERALRSPARAPVQPARLGRPAFRERERRARNSERCAIPKARRRAYRAASASPRSGRVSVPKPPGASAQPQAPRFAAPERDWGSVSAGRAVRLARAAPSRCRQAPARQDCARRRSAEGGRSMTVQGSERAPGPAGRPAPSPAGLRPTSAMRPAPPAMPAPFFLSARSSAPSFSNPRSRNFDPAAPLNRR